MKYTYRSGQRPLDGYTIKRGVGQGGFGEVYFAVSDGGKEVALKLLKGQSDVELRGVANCLNMKHPNLVHVYDLKEDGRGDKWLVMEYVLGESMSAVLGRYPTGLPANLAREWFAALAKAVAYLHDRGVVHRDLKPANVFIESGTLKVGDYGLCKAISPSQKQTRTVGTVHYMAPEVSTGNYSQSIDIYACGIMLHEMLTGELPFDGESDGEILMKHLTALPELEALPEAMRPIVARALDKNPRQRYGSVNDMARAVEAAFESMPKSVGHGSTIHRATPVAATVAVPLAAKIDPPVREAVPPPLPPAAPMAILEQAGFLPTGKDATPLPKAIPVTWRQRVLARMGAGLAVPFLAMLGLLPFVLINGQGYWQQAIELLMITTALAWSILFGTGAASSKSADLWSRRLVLGFLGLGVGALAYWVGGWEIPAFTDFDSVAVLSKYALYFGGFLAAGRWWKSVARDRKERFGLFPIIVAGFWSGVLLFLWPPVHDGNVGGALIPAMLSIAVVQLVSPWTPPMVRLTPKKLKLKRS